MVQWLEKTKLMTVSNKSTVLVTGGFDPLHSGHIAYFKDARALGDKLVVGINSDEWLMRKKGKAFMPFTERVNIIKNLKMVDKVIAFDDSDNTANQAIFHTMSTNSGTIIFANGGDRSDTTTPEYKMYGDHPSVEFAFGVGGDDKKNSSSWILDEWKTQKTERDWGYWRVLDNKSTVKVKELVINPGDSLSDQKHMHRHEHWYILEGRITIECEYPPNSNIEWSKTMLTPNQTFIIDPNVWHKTTNIGDTPAHILEVQYGEKCVEEDIIRR